ncbi:MAG: hypothetical protein KKH01_01820 [Firmicutes bacterium]|nr:hypothetical protein [Bacillota bacterium]
MEENFIGKSTTIYNKELVNKAYLIMYKKRLTIEYLVLILMAVVTISNIVAYIIPEGFINLEVVILDGFLTVSILILITMFKRNIKNLANRIVKSNEGQITNVFYYVDKMHIQSSWDDGQSEYDIDFKKIDKIFMNNKFFVILFNQKTQFLNVMYETLVGITKEQIIDQVKNTNPDIKLIKYK